MNRPFTEREEAVRQLAIHGPPPEGPVVAQAGAPAPAIATAAQMPLSDDDILSLPYPTERYVLANKKAIWVHPVSIEEAAWLNAKAAQEVRALALTDDNAAAIRFQAHARVWQVVLCVRSGPELGAPTALKHAHAEVLRRNAGWLNDVDRIVKISDGLTGGASESERLKEALRGFFETAESFCETLISQLDTDTPEALRPTLEGFVGSVTQAKSLLN